MPDREEQRITLLKDTDRRTTSVQWPEAVDRRLELLQRLLAAEGTSASRAQILAALVAGAPIDGSALAEQVRQYLRQPADTFDEHPPYPLPRVRARGARRQSSTD